LSWQYPHVSPTPARLTYRSLFAIREFRVLFFYRAILIVSVSASGLALGTTIYQATRSPVLTGLSMFGGPLVSLVVSQFLLALSDRIRPRTALLCQLGSSLFSHALQLAPWLPWPARLILMAIPYAVYAMTSGIEWSLVREIVPADSYVLARSTMNLAESMQVVGYGIGGLALLLVSPRGLFLFAAIADLLALVNVRLGIRRRPARAAAWDDGAAQGGTGARGAAGSGPGTRAGRPGVVRRTAAVNARLLRSPVTRPLYLALWVPPGLIVGCESLFVPYAHSGSAGHEGAVGWLFAAAAAGMVMGDLLVGRFVPAGLRDRLIGPLRLLLAAPYLFFFLAPPVAVAIPLGFLASAGYAASLPLQDRLVRNTDGAIQGQVLGLETNGVMLGQGAAALIAGAVASWLPPATAIGVIAVASTAVTLLLVPGLRRSAKAARQTPARAVARDAPAA
jgi:hypothetical protein